MRNGPVRSLLVKSALATLIIAGVAGAGPAQAAGCRNSGSFEGWLDGFRKEARADGISRSTIRSALGNVTFDPRVVKRDRSQGVFSQSFLKFASRMINKNRLGNGRARLKKHRALFKKVEQRYGVPGAVIAAFWGLETDFGGNMGDFSVLRSLATLAYDCRRPDKFRPQLMDALRLLENGDLRLSEMVGAWAGEIGQTQFLPTEYNKFAIDFDGDGKRNLRRSLPDVLASTANVIRHFGWQAGQPWLREVRVPRDLPWQEADIAIKHPVSQWAKWGVKRANGKALRADNTPASLVLPMGRNGPAFLAYPNFGIYLEWNHSLVYTTTAAYFATRLAGARPVSQGNGKASPLTGGQMKQLQSILHRRGYDVGKIDGVLGAGTRAAVKAMQLKLGMPADSYPTVALLNRLR